MTGKVNKDVLQRVGRAALSGWSDAEIAADPAGATRVAMAAMRGLLPTKRKPD